MGRGSIRHKRQSGHQLQPRGERLAAPFVSLVFCLLLHRQKQLLSRHSGRSKAVVVAADGWMPQVLGVERAIVGVPGTAAIDSLQDSGAWSTHYCSPELQAPDRIPSRNGGVAGRGPTRREPPARRPPTSTVQPSQVAVASSSRVVHVVLMLDPFYQRRCGHWSA